MAMVSDNGKTAVLQRFASRHPFRWYELLPWIVAVAAYFVFPNYLALGAQILTTIIFGLSVDLVLGYAGIVTLGHAAFFGAGAYTAGILAANGWGDPITGLIAAALVAAALGIVTGAIILRTTGLTLLMLTLVVAAILLELANKAGRWTGGADGLARHERVADLRALPLRHLRQHRLHLLPHRIAGRLALCPIDRLLALRSLAHRHPRKYRCVCTRSARRSRAACCIAYTISAALAGISGALITQTTQLSGSACSASNVPARC